MKILQIMAGNEEGGLEQHFEMLCNRLSVDHEVYVIAHEKYRNRFVPEVGFYPLDLSKGRRNPLLLYRLYHLIREINPQILHAHANKAVTMVAAISRFLPQHMKRIATLHSQKRSLKRYEVFDHVIGVSQRVIEPLHTVSKSVVYNGIDLPEVRYDPDYLKDLGVSDRSFVLCAIGRMEKVKNFEMLLHAIKGLDVLLLLVGEGSQRTSLEAVAKHLGVDGQVRFTGYRDDVPKLLRHSDLCVISSDREGFSYVMAEALLLEKPVVSTDVGDMCRILPQSCVVPRGDTAALHTKIAEVQSHYQEVLEQFEGSFAFARTHFTLSAMVRGVEEVYNKVMHR